MGTIALVDGRNTAYRTVFAAQGNEDFAKYHPFALWLKFSRDWIGKYMPDAVHVFWDANKKTLWRNQLLAEYKGQRAAALERHGFDVGAEIGKLEGAANSVLPAMGVRQFQRDGQEADDPK
jgi:5'-3' exonuclease